MSISYVDRVGRHDGGSDSVKNLIKSMQLRSFKKVLMCHEVKSPQRTFPAYSNRISQAYALLRLHQLLAIVIIICMRI